MDWSGFASRLRESCGHPVVRLPEGVVLRPKDGPLDLRELLAKAAEPMDLARWAKEFEEENLGDLLEEGRLPHDVVAVLKSRWNIDEVVTFEWESFMTTWFASLDLLASGDGREYVMLFQESDPSLKIVAALEPNAGLRSFTEFFRTLLADNGDQYGVEMFGGLPTTTTVLRPDLLGVGALPQVYFDWMEFAAAADFASWADLRDNYLHSGLDSPSAGPAAALERAAAGIQRFGKANDPHAILGWLESRRREGDDLSEEDRKRIIENYCETSICTPPRQAEDGPES